MRDLTTFRMIEDIASAGSVRKAAADLHITPSALNRRLRQFEEEFGAEIFERLPRGVRLNQAGELLLRHIRQQLADFERVRMDVADLSGMRSGHVSIACSQALMNIFLPAEIARFRKRHPGVTFSLKVRDRAAAERDLLAFSSDIALVFEPMYLADFEMIAAVPQRLCAIMAADHPLAQVDPLRLADCLAWPHVVPTGDYGVRHVLELAAGRLSLRLAPVIEAESFEFMRYYVLQERAVSFQIRLGLKTKAESKTLVREIVEEDLPPGTLFVGKLRSRELPVAAESFAAQISASLARSAGQTGVAGVKQPASGGG
ncbi:LysR family transcriptional regulator [Paralimibaculum aggregatum]|uniref:LysR family transcriptional regulator n=1 Tax=Paralimibaculum aggregatum TaxID=3036245 RepID=A0ABQ6LPY9_9RHOB|nr:LysR family transcriptional regulator [Limibaculum sp. NKW23]GMG83033.1 LysR family transcriptional regulator [Limibaculum sp. NKW23]